MSDSYATSTANVYGGLFFPVCSQCDLTAGNSELVIFQIDTITALTAITNAMLEALSISIKWQSYIFHNSMQSITQYITPLLHIPLVWHAGSCTDVL